MSRKPISMASISSLFVLSLWVFTTLLSAAAEPAPPLLLSLTHTLSNTHQQQQSQNTTTHQFHYQLLTSASLRSAARFRHHRRLPRRRQVSLPLSPGSDYTLSFSVGSSSRRSSNTVVELYMDTGSDLVWFPCAPFECILCEGKPNYPPHPGSLRFPTAAAVPCHSRSCSAAHSSLPSSDLCAVAGCPLETIETSTCSAFPCPLFYYAYGDGSLVARLRRDNISVPAAGSPDPLQLPDFTFGCAHTALAEPIGVAGFGRGLLSLPAQLSRLSPHLGKQFSYCLVSHSFEAHRLRRPSPLILGRSSGGSSSPESGQPFVYTPMLDNPKHPYFYTVGIDAVLVGGRRIAAAPSLRRVSREGNGGVVVDSGTTFTMLPAETHARVAEEFDRRMVSRGRERAAATEAETGLNPCYYEQSNSGGGGGSAEGVGEGVPSMVLQFAGNASVALPRTNYYLGFTRGGRRVGCLMAMSGGDDEEESGGGGPAGTLGNFQQQGFEVVYDLEGKKVGFARRRCAALWDSLSRGI